MPAFDAERLLPAAFVPWIADIAERAQCPPDYVAVAAVVAFSSVVGRSLTIRPKQQDDWTVVPNLWGVAIGPPGLMKTSAMQEALRPLQRLIADARQAHQVKMKDHAFLVAEAEARRKALKKELDAAVKDGRPTDAIREKFGTPSYVAPVERRYLINDSTVEKLGELLKAHANGLLLFRDEMGGLLRTMEREGHENDRAFLCECWNGNGSYTYDRIGRGTVRVEACCLSILGGIQPGPLHHYLRETFGGGQDDGLVQRFQLMVYPDVVGTWRNIDRWPDGDARRRVAALFQWAANLDTDAIGGRWDRDDDLPFLRFELPAQASFDEWRTGLERRLREEELHPVLASHLAKYRSLVPSLALLFHVAACADTGAGGPVTAGALARALAWIPYLEKHARRVYEGVTAAARLSAIELSKKILTGKVTSPFRAREVRRNQWTALTTPDEVGAALDCPDPERC